VKRNSRNRKRSETGVEAGSDDGIDDGKRKREAKFISNPAEVSGSVDFQSCRAVCGLGVRLAVQLSWSMRSKTLVFGWLFRRITSINVLQ